jgi:uncharacterized membrane protein
LIITSFTIPLVILFTGVSLWQALMINVSAIGFFIVFGMAYNVAFDAVMTRLQERTA